MSELRHRFHGHGNGTFTIAAEQDVEPILEANKAGHLAGKQRGDIRLVASIPAILIEKWLNEEGFNLLTLPKREFTRIIAKKRRDPDYRWLFTS